MILHDSNWQNEQTYPTLSTLWRGVFTSTFFWYRYTLYIYIYLLFWIPLVFAQPDVAVLRQLPLLAMLLRCANIDGRPCGKRKETVLNAPKAFGLDGACEGTSFSRYNPPIQNVRRLLSDQVFQPSVRSCYPAIHGYPRFTRTSTIGSELQSLLFVQSVQVALLKILQKL